MSERWDEVINRDYRDTTIHAYAPHLLKQTDSRGRRLVISSGEVFRWSTKADYRCACEQSNLGEIAF